MRHQRLASEHLHNLANLRCNRRFDKCRKAQEAVDESTFQQECVKSGYTVRISLTRRMIAESNRLTCVAKRSSMLLKSTFSG